MTARELMRRTFEVVHPEALLEHVAGRPESAESGPLLVCEEGRLIGVLDLRELAARARGSGTRRTRVRDVVPRDVLYCLESTDLAEAVALMRENQVGWIPVLGAGHRPAGLLALRDVPEAVESSHAGPPAERGAKRA